ncbi:hypothetical protein [Insolitispirillum peregrinum]|uniref:hypothetical protein n=1 Tax=Insolitispirillum peregrinum TaxID=80876 RepID=UPI003619B3BE
MMRRSLLFAFCLSGCMSVADIEKLPTTRSGQLSGNYIDVASCISDALADAVPVLLTVDQATQTAVLTSVYRNDFVKMPMYVMTLTQQGEGSMEAKLQSGTTVFGTPYADSVRAWEVAETCGGGTHAVRSPTQR